MLTRQQITLVAQAMFQHALRLCPPADPDHKQARDWESLPNDSKRYWIRIAEGGLAAAREML